MTETFSDVVESEGVSLDVLPLADLPEGTVEVLAAVYYLRDIADRRVKRGAIRDRIVSDMSRDQVRYRLDRLEEEGVIYQDQYQDHRQVINEYYIDGDLAREDARRCYEAVKLLPEGGEELTHETVIALAGEVGTMKDRLARLEEEVDIDDDDDVVLEHRRS